MKSHINIPLCVDLDGTLIATDMLYESIAQLLKVKPFAFFLLPFWLMKGRGYLKEKIEKILDIDVKNLPYREDLIGFLKEERAKGRKIILATASNAIVAAKINDHLNIFDEVLGSTSSYNLKGSNKAKVLVDKYGKEGFIYAGDSTADLKVWEKAKECILVDGSGALKSDIDKLNKDCTHFEYLNNTFKQIIKEIRVYQWVKNLLIFLPMIMAHIVNDPGKWIESIIAFVAFSLTASSIYVYNDMLDLKSDRLHPRKRYRPLASGKMTIKLGLLIAPTFILISFALAYSFLPIEFMWALLTYLILTMSYSVWLKRLVIMDLVVLAALYTMRLIAGSVAADVTLSPWLLGFSLFLFFSLAVVKRYTELLILENQKREYSTGRGYKVTDKTLLLAIGPTSGFMAILVFAFYINSEKVINLYNHPEYLWLITPLLLFWISRIWIVAHRGEMHDDPIVFTGKDIISYLIMIATVLIAIGATL